MQKKKATFFSIKLTFFSRDLISDSTKGTISLLFHNLIVNEFFSTQKSSLQLFSKIQYGPGYLYKIIRIPVHLFYTVSSIVFSIIGISLLHSISFFNPYTVFVMTYSPSFMKTSTRCSSTSISR